MTGEPRGIRSWCLTQTPTTSRTPTTSSAWLAARRPEHDYDALCELDLLPATADYQALIDESAQTFAQALVEQVPELLALAQLHKGRVLQGLIADTIRVRLYCDADNEAPLVTLAYSSRPGRRSTASTRIGRSSARQAEDPQQVDSVGGWRTEPAPDAGASAR
jgi:hypothetical protein